jgi:predicted AlkP superfamily phosphohydrolase/phosphomutase
MKNKMSRREFLRHTALATAVLTTGFNLRPAQGGKKTRDKKVIVIGFDGMDPGLCEEMMNKGLLPNFDNLRKSGGYSRLGTTTPPQSPVAWASFINGAGPGSHGIFDFIHRDPAKQAAPYYSAAKTEGGKTVLLRGGTPFWDYLDEAGINSTFYDLPSNYPPSPSKHGNHKCLSGMGTPDMLGTYGTYQHYSEDGPVRPRDEPGGKRYMLFFEDNLAPSYISGPTDALLEKPASAKVEFKVYRQKETDSAMIDIQGTKIILKTGQWSDWQQVTFKFITPLKFYKKKVTGICRFYLQEVAPNLRLYASPINIDPSKPASTVTEPAGFIKDISKELGLFYTTGFQEDHKALSNGIFTDGEYVQQAEMVLDERVKLLDYATNNYDDGLLFFYFSSTDMQAHMLWWDSDEKHPTRSDEDAKACFGHLKGIYKRMDTVLGNILKRYGDSATVMVLSDHGFANFKRQFNINTWLKENGYIQKPNATGVLVDVDWSRTRAYGMGINGLYVNEKGREKHGIVNPGQEKEQLLDELTKKLEAVRDTDGSVVISKVSRADKIYSGTETAAAPDLIVGYARGYRASWDTCLGKMDTAVLSDNESVWAADHCADASQVPGILFTNKSIAMAEPSLIDLAPTILRQFGMEIPETMEGKDIF